MQSKDESQLRFPGRSLWLTIAEHVPESELPQIQRALGCSLLDEYSGLHLEAEMLYKTWQGIRQAGNHGNRAGTPLKCQQGSPLADPHTIKELLRAEVQMLQPSFRERAISEGRPHSVQSNIEEEIEAVRDKLNITDIDKVVDQLRSVLYGECEALKRHIEHLKENIKRGNGSPREVYKVESTFADLRELRGVSQMDLELKPSSSPSSCWPSSLVPVKDLKNRHRFSAKFRTSDAILEGLTATSLMRPHPPPPLCQAKPSPPLRDHLSKTSATVKPTSPHLLAQCIGASASPEARKPPTPLCHSVTACEHCRSHRSTFPPRIIGDKIITKTQHHCSPSAKPESGDFPSGPPTSDLQMKTQRNSTIHKTPHSFPSREWDLSPQMERKGSLVYKSRHADINPAHSDGAHRSGDSADRSLSTAGTSAAEACLNRQSGASESVRSGAAGKYSFTFETVTPLEQNLNRTSNHGIHKSHQVV